MPIMRIILPLVIAGLFIYAPLIKETKTGSFSGSTVETSTGGDMYIGTSFNCAMEMKFNPLMEGCSPTNGMTGWVVYTAVTMSIIAAALGVLGLIPFLSRIASTGTLLAGVAALAACGLLIYQFWQREALPDVQWFMWVLLGVSGLTLLVGLSAASSDD